jgi:hypothetical protein
MGRLLNRVRRLYARGLDQTTFNYAVAAAVLMTVVALMVMPWVIGPGLIRAGGQFTLLPGDFTAHQADRCSGQGRYADILAGKKISLSAGTWSSAIGLGEGVVREGQCVFPFSKSVPAGMTSYVFEARGLARWVFTESEMHRPLTLTFGQA